MQMANNLTYHQNLHSKSHLDLFKTIVKMQLMRDVIDPRLLQC